MPARSEEKKTAKGERKKDEEACVVISSLADSQKYEILQSYIWRMISYKRIHNTYTVSTSIAYTLATYSNMTTFNSQHQHLHICCVTATRRHWTWICLDLFGSVARTRRWEAPRPATSPSSSPSSPCPPDPQAPHRGTGSRPCAPCGWRGKEQLNISCVSDVFRMWKLVWIYEFHVFCHHNFSPSLCAWVRVM